MTTKFPVLNLMVRYGLAATVAFACVMVAGLSWLTVPILGCGALPLWIVLGAAVLVLGASFVELIKLISETLMPQ